MFVLWILPFVFMFFFCYFFPIPIFIFSNFSFIFITLTGWLFLSICFGIWFRCMLPVLYIQGGIKYFQLLCVSVDLHFVCHAASTSIFLQVFFRFFLFHLDDIFCAWPVVRFGFFFWGNSIANGDAESRSTC